MTQTTTEMKSLSVRESKDLTIAQKLARRGLLRAFSKVRYGRLTVADGEDTFSFEGPETGPEAHITILNPQVWADRKSTRLNSSHSQQSRMTSSA